MPYLYLLAAIVAEVIGTTALKSANGFTRLLPSLVTAAGYATAFFFLSLALRPIPTGVAYAIWSGIGIVLVTMAAWAVHGQRLDAGAYAGMALIIAGVAVMHLFSRTPAT